LNTYETTVILNAELPDETIEASIQKLHDLITGDGGEVLKVDRWGRRKMAYEINKKERGYYALLLHNAPAATIKKLEDFFKVTDTVIKFMNVKLEKKRKEAALRSLAEAALAEATPAEPQPAEPAPEAEA
jgi:small subunit ribosomal protein S6